MSQPSEPVFSVEVDVSWDDVREFYIFNGLGNGRKSEWFGRYGWRTYLLGFGMCLGATLLLYALVQTQVALVAGAAAFGALFLGWAAQGLLYRPRTWDRGWEHLKADPAYAQLVGRHILEMGGFGIRIGAGSTTAKRPWSQIIRTARNGLAIYVWESPNRAIVFPESLLRSLADAQAMYERILAYQSDAPTVENPEVIDGALVSPEFSIGERHLYAAASLSATSFVPGARELIWTVPNAFVAVAMWPWTRAPVALVVGPLCVCSVGWKLVGSRLRERYWLRSLAKRQLATPEQRAGFENLKLAIGPGGLIEASPRSRNEETWNSITSVVPRADATFFVNSRAGIYVLPHEAFETDDAYFNFVEQALEYRRAALAAA